MLAAAAFVLATPLASQSGTPVAPTEQPLSQSLPGAFVATPDGEGPFPAIILLGGSEGGDSAARRLATRFLEQGYAVIGYPFYSPAYFGQAAQFPDLPRAFAAIPVDRMETVMEAARANPAIGDAPIGLYGVSKGAEFALLAASLIEGFDAVAAIVPSDVVWEGWGPGIIEGESSSFSWRGEPLPFVPYVGMTAEIAKYADPDATPRLRTPQDLGRHRNPDRVAAARIRVEEIDEPVLVAGGDQDNTWASGEMAQYIAERRYAAGLPTVSLIFTDAGHGLSGDGTQITSGSFRYSDADLAAQAVIWPQTLSFFARYLKRERISQAN